MMEFDPLEDAKTQTKFPYLVVRYMAAVYGKRPFLVSEGEPSFKLGDQEVRVQFPTPFETDGSIAQKCREFILQETLEAVKRTRFRMCVVWGQTFATYVESNGSFNDSNHVPAGGIQIHTNGVSES